MAGLKPTAADVRMGARLHEARRALSLSQRATGEALGISAAQLQKYEKGTNKIAATTLAVFARLTERPISWFFGEEPSAQPDLSEDEHAELETAVLGAVDKIVGRRRAAQSEARV